MYTVVINQPLWGIVVAILLIGANIGNALGELVDKK